jgi:predicted DNA-binding WGR domain protein
MAKLTLSDARRTMGRGRPWTFRLEYHDTSANSHKFWLCTGRGRNEPVEIHYGRVGGKPQVIVKDWLYVEAKAPDKEAKGYRYTDTGFVKVRQSTIDDFVAGAATQAAKPLPAKPAPTPPPAPAKQPTPDEWRCDKGGLTMRIKGSRIEIEFDVFPADWQGAVYHTFKDDLGAFCSKHMARNIPTWWGGDSSEVFHAHSNNQGLFKALVGWLQNQIGVTATPLTPPAKLTGPFAQVVALARKGKGIWHAIDSSGDKVLSLTAKGARSLLADQPSITVVGL